MIEEQGMVVSVPRPGRAVIAVTKGSACHGCSQKKSCNLSLDTGQLEVEVDNRAGARPGNKVLICIPPRQLVKGSLIGYLVPALSLIIGAVAGSGSGWFANPDTGAIIVGFAALLLSLAVVLQYDKIFHKGKLVQPSITKIIA
ncbi:MAG: SoxR reducing system RseC family protein [bacterium]